MILHVYVLGFPHNNIFCLSLIGNSINRRYYLSCAHLFPVILQIGTSIYLFSQSEEISRLLSYLVLVKINKQLHFSYICIDICEERIDGYTNYKKFTSQTSFIISAMFYSEKNIRYVTLDLFILKYLKLCGNMPYVFVLSPA